MLNTHPSFLLDKRGCRFPNNQGERFMLLYHYQVNCIQTKGGGYMKRRVGKLVVGLVCVTALVAVTDSASAAEEKVKYLIGFEEEAELEAFTEEVDQVGVFSVEEQSLVEDTLDIDVDIIDEYDYIDVLSVELDPEDVDALSEEEGISYIEEDFELSIQQTVPWGITRVQAPTVHNRGITGSGVKVAILDTGIAQHSDLTIRGEQALYQESQQRLI